MRAFHDSRNADYRSPYGALELGAAVTLSIDVWDAANLSAKVRTWVDGEGETLYEMTAAPGPDGATRFTAALVPERAGIVWYQFVITAESGEVKRYGAADGKRGGAGRLLDWEPPSFQLSVIDEAGLDAGEGCAFLSADAAAPLATAVGFLRGEATARQLVDAVSTAHEVLPPVLFARSLDFLGAGERLRLFARLGGMDEWAIDELERRMSAKAAEGERNGHGEEPAPDDELALDVHHAGLGKGRLWCAGLVQLLMPGVGDAISADERAAGIEQWGRIDPDCEVIMVNASELGLALPALAQGVAAAAPPCFALNDDVFGFWRDGADGSRACLLVNGSLQRAHDVALPLSADVVEEVIAGYGVRVVDSLNAGLANEVARQGERSAVVHLSQLGTAVLYFHAEELLQKPFEAGFGVLAHITSLPPDAPAQPKGAKAKAKAVRRQGCLGEQARAFVDWLTQAGIRYWQVLPANPTDEYGSPYAGISAFAGNVRLLSEDALTAAGEQVRAEVSNEYRRFCEEQKEWLEPYVSFMAIRDKQRSKKAWQAWPKKYRAFDPKLIQTDEKLAELAEQHRIQQFAFDREWHALRSYANERGVRIIGDMPIYVSADSADVWAHPGLFQLGPDGTPGVVAGCPPDAFAEDGQVWGNPVYDWDALRATGFDWWLRRLQRAFDLYDFVRLDHFIGFSRYFAIPAGELATAGSYRPGPGIELFSAAFRKFGPLPVIAEDLGLITPAVRALVAECGFPGMDIVQFADGNDPLAGYAPRPGKIAYTGTHDNQTLVGYCAERYPQLDACETAERIARMVAGCDAPVCIMPLQDLMGLDDDARMNVPGTSEGNWAWQAARDGIGAAFERTHALVELHANSCYH